MTIMIARYERGKKLNVRKEPNPNAPVVRTMKSGEEAECLEIRDGWAKLQGGFANVSLLIVKLGEAVKQASEAIADALPEQAGEPEEQPEPEAPVADDDEAAELRKMTNPQLYELAEQSGIKVKKGATKAELIAAILADE